MPPLLMFPIPDCLYVLQVRELSRIHNEAGRCRLPAVHRPARLSGAVTQQGTAGHSFVGVKTVCPYVWPVIDLAAVPVSVDAGDAHCHRDARAQVQQTESQQKRRARVLDQSHRVALPSASLNSKFRIIVSYVHVCMSFASHILWSCMYMLGGARLPLSCKQCRRICS